MYLSYQQVRADTSVKTVSNLTVPGGANWVELQATGANIRYTMDNSTNPTTTTGMLLINGNDPKLFLIEDLRRIRFIRSAAGAFLNAHFGAGRDV